MIEGGLLLIVGAILGAVAMFCLCEAHGMANGLHSAVIYARSALSCLSGDGDEVDVANARHCLESIIALEEGE